MIIGMKINKPTSSSREYKENFLEKIERISVGATHFEWWSERNLENFHSGIFSRGASSQFLIKSK